MTPKGDVIEHDQTAGREFEGIVFDDCETKCRQTWTSMQVVRPLDQTFSSAFNPLIEHFLLRGCWEDGIDELIMHMTAVDAAIGSRHYKRVTTYRSMIDAIPSRLKRLLKDEAAAEEFGRLYDVRSVYIHGRDQDGTILTSDLISARKLARRAAEGVLQYARNNPDATRDQMLDVLDGAIS